MTKIRITRDCEANLNHNSIPCLRENDELTGVFREVNHPNNAGIFSLGCIEIDTEVGTFTIPANACEVIRPMSFGEYTHAVVNELTNKHCWKEHANAFLYCMGGVELLNDLYLNYQCQVEVVDAAQSIDNILNRRDYDDESSIQSS